MAGGMPGEGACVARGVRGWGCGCVHDGGMHGRGVCRAGGGVRGGGTCVADTTRYSQ